MEAARNAPWHGLPACLQVHGYAEHDGDAHRVVFWHTKPDKQ